MLENEIEKLGIDLMDYDKRNSRYRIKLTMSDVKKHKNFIGNLVRMSKNIELENKLTNRKNTTMLGEIKL